VLFLFKSGMRKIFLTKAQNPESIKKINTFKYTKSLLGWGGEVGNTDTMAYKGQLAKSSKTSNLYGLNQFSLEVSGAQPWLDTGVTSAQIF
jgi:hypothetical protein